MPNINEYIQYWISQGYTLEGAKNNLSAIQGELEEIFSDETITGEQAYEEAVELVSAYGLDANDIGFLM